MIELRFVDALLVHAINEHIELLGDFELRQQHTMHRFIMDVDIVVGTDALVIFLPVLDGPDRDASLLADGLYGFFA